MKYGLFKALIYEDHEQVREYTNVEAAREAIQLAAGLRSLGVEKGDRVIVMMLTSPEVLISYQAISRAGAIIIPVMPLLKGPEVKAFVVTRGEVDAETLNAYCREYLANYKTPSEIEFVSSLPRNAMGKIEKKELQKALINENEQEEELR